MSAPSNRQRRRFTLDDAYRVLWFVLAASIVAYCVIRTWKAAMS